MQERALADEPCGSGAPLRISSAGVPMAPAAATNVRARTILARASARCRAASMRDALQLDAIAARCTNAHARVRA